HTHPVFAGSRADEFAERVSGAEYQAQQSGGRGIARTVRATREADAATLLALTEARANRVLVNGTTTIEAKTGYGLDLLNGARGRRSRPSSAPAAPTTWNLPRRRRSRRWPPPGPSRCSAQGPTSRHTVLARRSRPCATRSSRWRLRPISTRAPAIRRACRTP